jgi:hypothetical protein
MLSAAAVAAEMAEASLPGRQIVGDAPTATAPLSQGPAVAASSNDNNNKGLLLSRPRAALSSLLSCAPFGCGESPGCESMTTIGTDCRRPLLAPRGHGSSRPAATVPDTALRERVISLLRALPARVGWFRRHLWIIFRHEGEGLLDTLLCDVVSCRNSPADVDEAHRLPCEIRGALLVR